MGNDVDVDDGRERSRSWRATQRQSSGRTATRPPPSRVKGRGKCKSRARIRTRDGGWKHEPTWSGVEWRKEPSRSAKIAKFMKECGKNSKSEETLCRLRVNPLIEEDPAKLRRRIPLLLMPCIPCPDSACRWNGGMREVGWEKEGTGHSHGQRSQEGR